MEFTRRGGCPKSAFRYRVSSFVYFRLRNFPFTLHPFPGPLRPFIIPTFDFLIARSARVLLFSALHGAAEVKQRCASS
jgi:hypothetical protein